MSGVHESSRDEREGGVEVPEGVIGNWDGLINMGVCQAAYFLCLLEFSRLK